MLFLEVAAAFAASACGILAILIGKGESTWGARHPALFKLFIVLSLTSFVALVVLAVAEERQSGKAAEETTALLAQASAERESLLEEVQDVGNQLAPFIEVATALYPNVDSEEALRLLTSRLDLLEERTETLELQFRFQTLDTLIRAQVVEQLRTAMNDTAVRAASVHVECEVSSSPLLEIGAEIVEILVEAGYSTAGPTTVSRVYAGRKPSVAIGYTPSCEDLANLIYGALRLMLRTEFASERLGDVDGECRFTLYIGGDPLFDVDGTVKFR
jgi:chaperonin cofactor prefoldin